MALVTSKEMFAKAYDGGYAIGAFNVNNMEIVQGITEACQEEHAPVILQVSKGARAYANHTYLVKLVEAAVENCPDIPIVLHLDHGPDFETCKSCIDGGFTSVMIDASSKPFAENIEITRKVVEYAHDHGVVVEAELGTLAGIEDDVKVADHAASYTRPEEVEEFVAKTGCDSLAIAIGTSHGAYKFKPEQCTVNEKGILVPPPLRFDVLEEVSKRLPGFPIVLHGSSSVPQEYVKMINDHGGKMPNAIGVPEEQLRQAARLSVCKINIDSDLRLAMTASIRKYFDEHPEGFDPRAYLKPARGSLRTVFGDGRHGGVGIGVAACHSRCHIVRLLPRLLEVLEHRVNDYRRHYQHRAQHEYQRKRPSSAFFHLFGYLPFAFCVLRILHRRGLDRLPCGDDRLQLRVLLLGELGDCGRTLIFELL